MLTLGELGQKIIAGDIPHPPVCELVGMKAQEMETGRAVFIMDVDERHHNPMGTLHGGIFCDLADAAMGFAYASTLSDGETFSTAQLTMNYFRRVRGGRLKAEARLIDSARNSGYLECDIRDGDGKLLAKASCTCIKTQVNEP